MRADRDVSEPLTAPTDPGDLEALVADVRACRRCAGLLPHEPRPVLMPKRHARILIVGQAPSATVHATGIPWNDRSGDRLRRWLGVDREQFYGDAALANLPMGFCYPGRGRSGDLPPRRECAPSWHGPITRAMPDLSLVLLVGAYAQRYHLGMNRPLTDTVRAWTTVPAPYFPLPHPSPRNVGWFLANPWFEAEVVPDLRARVAPLLTAVAA